MEYTSNSHLSQSCVDLLQNVYMPCKNYFILNECLCETHSCCWLMLISVPFWCFPKMKLWVTNLFCSHYFQVIIGSVLGHLHSLFSAVSKLQGNGNNSSVIYTQASMPFEIPFGIQIIDTWQVHA